MTYKVLQDLALAHFLFIPTLFTTSVYLPSLCLPTCPSIQTSIRFWGVFSVPGVLPLQDVCPCSSLYQKTLFLQITTYLPFPFI